MLIWFAIVITHLVLVLCLQLNAFDKVRIQPSSGLGWMIFLIHTLSITRSINRQINSNASPSKPINL